LAQTAGIAKARASLHTAGMTAAPSARLGFFKLNVPDLEQATLFWREAFGFAVTGRFDEPEFREHILALPSQETGPSLMLVEYKDGRDVSVGPGHGPVGLTCDDIDASHDRAMVCDAEKMTGVFEAGGVRIAVLKSPQGHEIELIQLPG
jgi:lactoylglutathione lyase